MCMHGRLLPFELNEVKRRIVGIKGFALMDEGFRCVCTGGFERI